jgi:hypothetical protein
MTKVECRDTEWKGLTQFDLFLNVLKWDTYFAGGTQSPEDPHHSLPLRFDIFGADHAGIETSSQLLENKKGK